MTKITYCGICADFDQWDFMEKYGHFHACPTFDNYMKANDICGIFQEDIDEYIRQIIKAMNKNGIKTEIINDVVYDTIAVYE